MATRYIHKLLSLFYRQPNKREDARSFRTVNGVFGDWVTSAVEDVPPPYIEDEECFPPPPFEAPRLSICPHETMSFDSLQQVVNSLTIKTTDETVDTLTTSRHGHFSRLDTATGKTKTVCMSSPGFLIGSGTYILVDGKDTSHTSGLVLCFDWELGFLDGIRCQVETAAELKHYLGVESIPICPHKRMSDSDVINAIFGFVKRPSNQDVITNCDGCGTEIKVIIRMEGDDQICYVKTKRSLGTVEKPDDPVWLAHCSV